jgi:hypothetical protein
MELGGAVRMESTALSMAKAFKLEITLEDQDTKHIQGVMEKNPSRPLHVQIWAVNFKGSRSVLRKCW